MSGQLFGTQFLGGISGKGKIAIRRYLMCNRLCLRNEGHKRMLALARRARKREKVRNCWVVLMFLANSLMCDAKRMNSLTPVSSFLMTQQSALSQEQRKH